MNIIVILDFCCFRRKFQLGTATKVPSRLSASRRGTMLMTFAITAWSKTSINQQLLPEDDSNAKPLPLTTMNEQKLLYLQMAR